jgi:hypothetical protein
MKHYKVYVTTHDHLNRDDENTDVWIEIYSEGTNTHEAIQDAERRLHLTLGKSLSDFPGFSIFFKWED